MGIRNNMALLSPDWNSWVLCLLVYNVWNFSPQSLQYIATKHKTQNATANAPPAFRSSELPNMASKQVKSATQLLNEIAGQVVYQGPVRGLDHTDHAPKWACDVYVNGQLLGRSYGHKNKKDAKEMAAAVAAERLGLA